MNQVSDSPCRALQGVSDHVSLLVFIWNHFSVLLGRLMKFRWSNGPFTGFLSGNQLRKRLLNEQKQSAHTLNTHTHTHIHMKSISTAGNTDGKHRARLLSVNITRLKGWMDEGGRVRSLFRIYVSLVYVVLTCYTWPYETLAAYWSELKYMNINY